MRNGDLSVWTLFIRVSVFVFFFNGAAFCSVHSDLSIFWVYTRYHCIWGAAISNFHACSHIAEILTAVRDSTPNQFPCVCLNTLSSPPATITAPSPPCKPSLWSPSPVSLSLCTQVHARKPYHGNMSVLLHEWRIFNMMNARYSLNGYYQSHSFAFFAHYRFGIILLIAYKSFHLHMYGIFCSHCFKKLAKDFHAI